MTLEDRENRESRENRLQEIKEIVKRLQTIKEKGKNMEEFDFDALLEEVEVTKSTEKEEKQTDEDKRQDNDLDSIDSMDSSLDDLDSLIDDNNDSSDEVKEPNEIKEQEPETNPEIQIDYQKIIDELNSTIEELKGQLKAVEVAKEQEQIDSIGIEEPVNLDFDFAAETRSFLKEYAELEVEKQDLNERIKELKKEYDEQGVHVKEALKAWKEYQKQLKETPDEAQEVEQIKNLINSDDTLASVATSLVD
jgi:uncharacterized coiled-coil DUF342 family protein